MTLVDDIRKQLRQRLSELDEERETIQAALAATTAAPAVGNGRRLGAARKPGPRPSSPRARRGENQRKILEATKTGSRTLAELATTTGIKRTTLSATLSQMTKKDLLTKSGGGRYKARPQSHKA